MCVCTMIIPETFINQPVTVELPESTVWLELKQIRCYNGIYTVKPFTCIDLITSSWPHHSGKHIGCGVLLHSEIKILTGKRLLPTFGHVFASPAPLMAKLQHLGKQAF